MWIGTAQYSYKDTKRSQQKKKKEYKYLQICYSVRLYFITTSVILKSYAVEKMEFLLENALLECILMYYF